MVRRYRESYYSQKVQGELLYSESTGRVTIVRKYRENYYN